MATYDEENHQADNDHQPKVRRIKLNLGHDESDADFAPQQAKPTNQPLNRPNVYGDLQPHEHMISQDVPANRQPAIDLSHVHPEQSEGQSKILQAAQVAAPSGQAGQKKIIDKKPTGRRKAAVAANGHIDNDVQVIKNNSVSHSSKRKLTQTGQSTLRDVFTTGLTKTGQWTLQDQKRLGARVYRVKGYTTQAKIQRKFNQEKQQRFLRNLLMVILFIVVVVILFVIYNPVKDIIDVRKMLGMDSPFQSIPTLPPTEPTIGIP